MLTRIIALSGEGEDRGKASESGMRDRELFWSGVSPNYTESIDRA